MNRLEQVLVNEFCDSWHAAFAELVFAAKAFRAAIAAGTDCETSYRATLYWSSYVATIEEQWRFFGSDWYHEHVKQSLPWPHQVLRHSAVAWLWACRECEHFKQSAANNVCNAALRIP